MIILIRRLKRYLEFINILLLGITTVSFSYCVSCKVYTQQEKDSGRFHRLDSLLRNTNVNNVEGSETLGEEVLISLFDDPVSFVIYTSSLSEDEFCLLLNSIRNPINDNYGESDYSLVIQKYYSIDDTLDPILVRRIIAALEDARSCF